MDLGRRKDNDTSQARIATTHYSPGVSPTTLGRAPPGAHVSPRRPGSLPLLVPARVLSVFKIVVHVDGVPIAAGLGDFTFPSRRFTRS